MSQRSNLHLANYSRARMIAGQLLVFALLAGLASATITPNFVDWLTKSKFNASAADFQRLDLGIYGSFGGKSSTSETIAKQPIIFIHGNSDQARNDPGKTSEFQSGWDMSIDYFISQGYTMAELYGITWGPANTALASHQRHTYVQVLRVFVEAVLAYTDAPMIDVISHSMGVTLGRRVLKGGSVSASPSCHLGAPLTSSVDTFVGICGANRGLDQCYLAGDVYPTCNSLNGFDPGVCVTGVCIDTPASALSTYLADLHDDETREAAHVYTFWSYADDVIDFGDLVWGYPTSKIRGQDGQRTSDVNGHMAMKDTTGDWQYAAVVGHKV